MRFGVVVAVLCMVVTPALADWYPGDGHKMHFPQLPDPNGWDVDATYYEGLADDWTCSETGYVYDFHIWGSWKGDVTDEIDFIHTAIWSDDPVGDQGVPGEEPDNTWSKPLERIWHQDWDIGEFAVQFWETGDQGWYNPDTGLVIASDHDNTYQYNFENITDPFWQTEGVTYWLEISVRLPHGSTAEWGWKSSVNHWQDDAVWGYGEPDTQWQNELYEPPDYTQSLDLAFVITPEPVSLLLLVAGGLAIRRRRA